MNTPTMHTYFQTPTDVVRAARGIDFAYRQVGNRGGIPLVLANYFAANMDDWDPLIVEGLTADRDVITFDYAMLRTIQQPTLIVRRNRRHEPNHHHRRAQRSRRAPTTTPRINSLNHGTTSKHSTRLWLDPIGSQRCQRDDQHLP